MTVSSIIGTLSKGYLYTNIAKDVTRFVRQNLSGVEFDRDAWLQKAGLQTYTPARSTAANIGLLAAGAVIGGVVALALAPKTGEELRTDIKDRAQNFLNKSELTSRETQASA